MSGGHFDYAQNRIYDIAESIQDELNKQGKINPDFHDLPFEEEFHFTHSTDVQQIMQDAIQALKIAKIYAQRIDWYLSGDDGEESFKQRLNEELKPFNNGVDTY